MAFNINKTVNGQILPSSFSKAKELREYLNLKKEWEILFEVHPLREEYYESTIRGSKKYNLEKSKLLRKEMHKKGTRLAEIQERLELVKMSMKAKNEAMNYFDDKDMIFWDEPKYNKSNYPSNYQPSVLKVRLAKSGISYEKYMKTKKYGVKLEKIRID